MEKLILYGGLRMPLLGGCVGEAQVIGRGSGGPKTAVRTKHSDGDRHPHVCGSPVHLRVDRHICQHVEDYLGLLGVCV